ncbi:DMT family transporter [Neptunicella marina]|uniref:DMT family transporter n=1 Tax=Neptunicella marina TaxID=2125989 RepID=A0A8J6ITU0_9ALTE|nr:DMT family transporter [Neptunicella marina]MBC3766561.1 DMT family transporter [Neptunicella marina]
MNTISTLELILLSAMWGASFLFMREASPQFGPVALIMLRTAIATLFLLPFLLVSRQVKDCVLHWKAICMVGLVNTAIPFCLFAFATLTLGAGYTSIINACAPMFAAIIAFFWLGQRLTRSAIVGLVIGFSGVVVLVSGDHGQLTENIALPVLAGLGATALYGLAVCMTKHYLTGVRSLAIATGSQLFSAIILLPFAVFTWPETAPSSKAWWQICALGIACTGFAYILYFRLIANVGISKAVSVAYLVPLFGIVWGALFLGEVISVDMIMGGLTILLGVSLTTGLWQRKRLQTAK